MGVGSQRTPCPRGARPDWGTGDHRRLSPEPGARAGLPPWPLAHVGPARRSTLVRAPRALGGHVPARAVLARLRRLPAGPSRAPDPPFSSSSTCARGRSGVSSLPGRCHSFHVSPGGLGSPVRERGSGRRGSGPAPTTTQRVPGGDRRGTRRQRASSEGRGGREATGPVDRRSAATSVGCGPFGYGNTYHVTSQSLTSGSGPNFRTEWTKD